VTIGCCETQIVSPIKIAVRVDAEFIASSSRNDSLKRAANRDHESLGLAECCRVQAAADAGEPLIDTGALAKANASVIATTVAATCLRPKQHKERIGWRRGRDLNPRSGLPEQRLSRAPHSATLAPLHESETTAINRAVSVPTYVLGGTRGIRTPEPCGPPVFKTGAIVRSAIVPTVTLSARVDQR
jgi:hypothetical protein